MKAKRSGVAAALLAMAAVGGAWGAAPQGPGGILYVSTYSGGQQTLRSVRFDTNWDWVAGTTNVYPAFANSSTDADGAQYAGDPVTLRYPAAEGEYGSLLVGAYYDSTTLMQVLKLEPHADKTMTVTKVYGGRAYAANAFHTERMQQVLYDRNGAYAGSGKNGIVCVDYRRDDASTRPCPGWATDEDGNGVFDDAGVDSTTFTNLARMDRRFHYKLWKNCLFKATDHFTERTGSFQRGFRLTRRLPGGGYTNSVYICGNDPGAAFPPSIYFTYSGNKGPLFDVGDTDGDGIADVYVLDDGADKVWRLRDLNGDGDAMDPDEASVVFTFGVDITDDKWKETYNSGACGFELVDGTASGKGWCLLMRWYRNNTQYHYVLGVIGLNAAGNWDGNWKTLGWRRLNDPQTHELANYVQPSVWMEFQPIVPSARVFRGTLIAFR